MSTEDITYFFVAADTRIGVGVGVFNLYGPGPGGYGVGVFNLYGPGPGGYGVCALWSLTHVWAQSWLWWTLCGLRTRWRRPGSDELCQCPRMLSSLCRRYLATL